MTLVCISEAQLYFSLSYSLDEKIKIMKIHIVMIAIVQGAIGRRDIKFGLQNLRNQAAKKISLA